jgi:2-C-methyl-D-erythritol 2,4-cyclodiphosphate synthase
MGSQSPSGALFRIGHGYDLHRLAPVEGAKDGGEIGRPFVLGGVRFDHTHGPVAHSDGDALLHAVTDAILGALALPDIGQLFPDTDARWRGANSEVFLRETCRRMRADGWEIVNVDATVICERPKIGARKDEIRGSVARMLGIDMGGVNVKGKTHEKVDAVGEGRAIEAHAVVLLARSTRG